ncbi:acyl-CoA dehydrogenase family protein [soil metagenome]
MRFAFTDDQLAIADAVNCFLADTATSKATRAAMADGTGFDRPLWQALAGELALTGIAVPENYGGTALGMVESAIVGEALGRHVSAVPWVTSVAVATHALVTGGSTEQRDTWLPKLASGDAVATFALGTIAASDGRLSGVAEFVPHGTIADLFLVPTDDGTYLVPPDAPGLTVTGRLSLDQTRPLAYVALEGVIGEPLGDFDWASIEPRAWTAVAADALGGAQACLDHTVAYVQQRIQFGRTIGSFQAVKHQLADMVVAIEQARSAVYWAAGEIDTDGADARLAAHAAKSFACDTYAECAGHAIQLHGGIGFTWEHDAHLYFKRARANLSLAGAPVWHREEIARLIQLDRPCN